RFYEKVQALHQDPKASVDNPLLAFSLIKRLHSDWPNVIYSVEAAENTQALHAGLKEVEQELPGAEDLDGAARALMRLQDVYALSVKGMANGVFQRAGASRPPLYSPGRRVSLSADDCFHVGKVRANPVSPPQRFSSPGCCFRRDRHRGQGDAHGLPAPPLQAGNISHALSLSKEFLLYGMWGNLGCGRRRGEVLGCPPHICTAPASFTPLLAPTWGKPPGSDAREPHLGCSYETNGSPYLLLQPAKKEMIRIRPYVALYHDFISDAEAETIKGLAGPWLQRSVVASGEKQQKAEYRISKSAWLKDTADPVVRALEQRIAAVTGLDLRPPYAEYLQVVNYGLGGHYEPHFDHATSRKSPLYRMKSGNRIATVMIYVSPLPFPGLERPHSHGHQPLCALQNAALFWWNLRRNGDGDEDTLHAGCPVLAGDKWVANKWIHEHGQEFRRPCGANQQD
ncbi:Prolyl 4-hydroxylase subunit alpha-3, partial [Opisthocomus hoazin]